MIKDCLSEEAHLEFLMVYGHNSDIVKTYLNPKMIGKTYAGFTYSSQLIGYLQVDCGVTISYEPILIYDADVNKHFVPVRTHDLYQTTCIMYYRLFKDKNYISQHYTCSSEQTNRIYQNQASAKLRLNLSGYFVEMEE